MSPSPDPYQVLGVWQGASDKEIRRAYLKLVKEYHPDRNQDPGAAEFFKEITWAYTELGRPADERDDSVPARTDGPPPPGWLTAKKVFLGVAAIAILVVIVIVILSIGSHPAAPRAAAATPSATPSVQPSAEAAAEAARVNYLLDASAETRSPLATALKDVQRV